MELQLKHLGGEKPETMLTIFSIPKPFVGHIGTIQRNAIQSWSLLHPRCEIILFGDDEGTAETAAEFGVRHVPDVAHNEFGTPLVNSLFETAERVATHDVLCYVNADIILMSSFMRAVQQVIGLRRRFLMVGQRWDVYINELWNFKQSDWEKELSGFVRKHGKLHPPGGTDYFAFPRGLWQDLPPFAVGRPGWDNWLIYKARTRRIPVIDASIVTTVIHQNHDYNHVPERSDKGAWKGPEADRNRELIGSWEDYMFTSADATLLLTPEGLRRALYRWYVQRHLYTLPAIYPYLRLPVRLLLKLIAILYSVCVRLGLTFPARGPDQHK